ncbi:UNVERIFIED_ORG: hypothetical protein ABIC43_002259 [Variovorax guangxiensis]
MTKALFLSCSLSRPRERVGVRVAPAALARTLIPRLLPQAGEGANTEYPR